ncbi:hypothetical protein SAMN04487830_11872 [Pseudobutyrivibrio sp. OR37]|uniref:hypothetical protein n=1 Tax=Pseudobutyrivibrio sp. OR37 TaxID=1798186 RepID=UPI0008F11EC6|nr:hypothetical protein [Pseudobutyrivibrio sp. OR37]SFI03205.1 hypothetical protein SAMN04487830_11872 [Pseudobutyrivibrio sp. OR37]
MKKLLKWLGIFLSIIICIAIVALGICEIRTRLMQNDYSSIYYNEKYQTPIIIENVEVITQDISCGYAVIEMFSAWNGGDVTEESLYNQYGKVVTSTGNKFCQEMNKQFPEYKTEIHKYLKNSEFIDIMYDSLAAGMPVPFEWAALYGDQWTLHYSLIVGADIPNDKITVANPYGYYEEITVEELLARTSFEAYEDMPLFMEMGFAIGLFEKNTIYSVKESND